MGVVATHGRVTAENSETMASIGVAGFCGRRAGLGDAVATTTYTLEHQCLTDPTTSLGVQGVVVATASPRPTLLPRNLATAMEAIVSEFPEVTQLCVATTPMKHTLLITSAQHYKHVSYGASKTSPSRVTAPQ